MVGTPPIFPRRDTIFALASGAGRAAIAALRLSGPACASALAALAPGARFPDRVATLRLLRDPATGEPLDRALVVRFLAPRSFTGEEMAELHVTGGRAVIAGVVGALAKIPGLRPAEPGEFAWRAFENGKLDLSEVEGIADLVEAETAAQRRQALRIAGGALSRETEAIRSKLLEAMAILEAQIDFSDVEDADALSLDAARALAGEAARRVRAALASAEAGARLREGFNVVIAGPPNVGKSTLMNALARRDVSIVSSIPGTTRDLVEVSLDLQGLSRHARRHRWRSRKRRPDRARGRRARASARCGGGPDAVAERRGRPDRRAAARRRADDRRPDQGRPPARGRGVATVGGRADPHFRADRRRDRAIA